MYSGPLDGLLEQEQRFVDIAPADPTQLEDLRVRVGGAGFDVVPENGGLRVLSDPARSGELNKLAMDAGIILGRLLPRSETLEDVFLRMTGEESGDRAEEAR